MLVSELFRDAAFATNLGEIDRSEEATYIVEYEVSNGRYGDIKRIVDIYDVRHGIGVIGGCFYFDVDEQYVNIKYIKLER